MNVWTEKSIKLANKSSYLDKLQSVYPVIIGPIREIPEDALNKLKKAFDQKDGRALLRSLLFQKKFPIKDPYVAYFRRAPESIEKNPETVKRITGIIFDMGFDRMINGITEPKEPNRMMGNLFRRWLRTRKIPNLKEDDFAQFDGTAILRVSEAKSLSFAVEKLGFKGEKAPDFIAKNGGTFIIGEAKFLTDFGGHQDRQLEDVIKLAENESGSAVKVAVLDGVVWIRKSSVCIGRL